MSEPLDDLLSDFMDRALRSKGTPSAWYWNTAAERVRVAIGQEDRILQGTP